MPLLAENHSLASLIKAVEHLKEELFVPASLYEKAKRITDGVVRIFEADFARIWLVKRGDLCQKGCFHVQTKDDLHHCIRKESCLHLIASSGRYTHTDSPVHSRVPLGCYKIGMIASGEIPTFVTNDVVHDARVHHSLWAQELGLVAFAGFRFLSTEGVPIGVLALFSKQVITAGEESLLTALAGTAAHVMQSGLAEEQLNVDRLQLAVQIEQRTHELRLSEERLKLALDGSNDALWDLDVSGEHTFFSSRWFTMLGYQPDQLPHHYETWVKLIHPEDRERVLHLASQVLSGKNVDFQAEFRMKTSANTWRWILSRGKAVHYDSDGIPNRVVGTHTDITTQKQIEEQFRILVANLERANKELEDFAYIVSHDLKAPLRGIHSLASWLLEDYGTVMDERGQDYLVKMQARSKRMNDLIDGILQYSRAGRGQVNPVLLHTQELVQEIVETLTIPAGLTVTLQDGLPSVIYDRVHLQQIFQNLISNALVHMGKATGQVVISGKEQSDVFEFCIQDTGVGIEPQNIQKIFKMFLSLNSQEGRDSTGIGLSLVKRIVERNGGQVWVESRVGEGSAFYFSIPKTKPRMSTRLPRSLTLLIIDDSKEFVEVSRTLLALEGHYVLGALDGPQAFQVLAEYEGEVHVALMDVNIPGENPRERLAILKRMRPNMKIFVCTGYEQNEIVLSLQQAGVDGILYKPFTASQLNALIEKIVPTL